MGGCPETELRKRGSFGKTLRPGWDPVGVRGPGGDVQEAKESQAQGSGEGPGPGQRCGGPQQRRKTEALGCAGGDAPERGEWRSRRAVRTTAFRAVDEEEVPKELMFYPESSVPQGFYRELKPEYTQNKVL